MDNIVSKEGAAGLVVIDEEHREAVKEQMEKLQVQHGANESWSGGRGSKNVAVS